MRNTKRNIFQHMAGRTADRIVFAESLCQYGLVLFQFRNNSILQNNLVKNTPTPQMSPFVYKEKHIDLSN